MEREDNYETSDLWVSAFLLTSGGKMTDTYQHNGRIIFIFEDRERSEKLVQDYLMG